MDKEKIYDEQIAPLLLKAAEIAKGKGLALSALVQWSAEDIGRTEANPFDSFDCLWPQSRIMWYAARCKGNVDLLIAALQRDGNVHGHNSMYLHHVQS